MQDGYLIGLDFGTESARGVLIDVASGEIEGSHTFGYRHGVMTEALPDGTKLPPSWALQHAPDYTEAAADILRVLGSGKTVRAIGLGFTASSPLPARADGTPLSTLYPGSPHAYVKLWKHQAAQPWADRMNATSGSRFESFGGKISSEWLLPKAAQLAQEAPELWRETERFIESGDWLAWQLTGVETRSISFAAYKAQYLPGSGYPAEFVPELPDKLLAPSAIGTSAGALSAQWRERTGIAGDAIVAMPIIDSHVVMPAVGAVGPGTLVGALGTSAVYLLLDDRSRPFPVGLEGVAADAVIPGLWCYEAGQAAFGDTLAWFVRRFADGEPTSASFERYNAGAALLQPGANRLIALDWWNGCRVPFGDANLSGLMLGVALETTAVHIYRALLESLCYGARNIVEHLCAGHAPIDRVILTSGLSLRNELLMQLMADVLGRTIEVPQLMHATALGAAIHGAVAAGVVSTYDEGTQRFGATSFKTYAPNGDAVAIYDKLFRQYQSIGSNVAVREAMHAVRAVLNEAR